MSPERWFHRACLTWYLSNIVLATHIWALCSVGRYNYSLWCDRLSIGVKNIGVSGKTKIHQPTARRVYTYGGCMHRDTPYKASKYSTGHRVDGGVLQVTASLSIPQSFFVAPSRGVSSDFKKHPTLSSPERNERRSLAIGMRPWIRELLE